MGQKTLLISRDLLNLIRERKTPDYLYRQLAEECAELAHAALKVVRAQNGEISREAQ